MIPQRKEDTHIEFTRHHTFKPNYPIESNMFDSVDRFESSIPEYEDDEDELDSEEDDEENEDEELIKDLRFGDDSIEEEFEKFKEMDDEDDEDNLPF